MACTVKMHTRAHTRAQDAHTCKRQAAWSSSSTSKRVKYDSERCSALEEKDPGHELFIVEGIL